MICQRCQKNPATVQVTEIAPDAVLGPDAVPGPDGSLAGITDENLCSHCAQTSDLPNQPLSVKKSATEIWKLLQHSAHQARASAALCCPSCGMTLAEFRHRGRLGCSTCYETFSQPLEELFERIHGAVEHVGRLPGVDEADLERRRRVNELERSLESAIREEAYESAAKIRDELNQLKEA